MIKVFNKYQCSIVAIQEVPMKDIHKYGVIKGNLVGNSKDIYQVDTMTEKPQIKEAPSNLAIIGRYILTPDIFKILENLKPDSSSEIQITDALRIQALKGKVIAYKFKGRRFDCGGIDGFVSATNYFAKKFGIEIT